MSDSDVVSIHVDWPAATSEFLIGAAELNAASERLVLVNTARAFAVDPNALKTFLQNNPRALALFDCYYDEPIGRRSDVHDLLALPNFLVTPHSAYLTDDSHEAMAEMVVENLQAYLEGMPAPHLVKF
jgi:glycerate dehydrogenase